tara:strand:- start:6573 stop:7106 length:534 start_codon:yes stop_codon:yes gene_type:complete
MPENLYGSLLPQNNSIYNTGETALQSDAISGQIFGGTASQQEEAAGLMGNSGGGLNVGSAINLGLATADQLIPGASSNPYLNAAKNNPLMKAGLKTMNPFIIGAGLVTTVAMGGREKKKQEMIDKQADINNQNKQVLAEGMQSKKQEVSDFYAGQRKAAGNAYGVGDIDNFLIKNRV